MNRDRVFTSPQLAEILGHDGVSHVHRLAERISIEQRKGVGRPARWCYADALGLLVADRMHRKGVKLGAHDVRAAHAVIALVHRGYSPSWVAWATHDEFVRVTALSIEQLYERVPQPVHDDGFAVLNISELVDMLDGVRTSPRRRVLG